ncbi:MAG: hypothetical protein KDD53_04410 [Bdellovibrionales bacterium]|nr:hypothetical protein [Bdellovibrionales bacterium]
MLFSSWGGPGRAQGLHPAVGGCPVILLSLSDQRTFRGKTRPEGIEPFSESDAAPARVAYVTGALQFGFASLAPRPSGLHPAVGGCEVTLSS